MGILSKAGQWALGIELFTLYERRRVAHKTIDILLSIETDNSILIGKLSKSLQEMSLRIPKLEETLCDSISITEVNENIYK
jgi:hypothetical protein